ncbi:MAG: KaiC domain-containing protein, partial [Thermoplasmata archaeon]
GDVIRFLRIDGCRLTGHDSRTWVFEITEAGLVNIIAPLSDYIRR